MQQVLNQIFLEDIIFTLDEKYQNLLTEEKNKLFLYANIFEYPLYFKQFSFKKDPDYGLYEKFHNTKIINSYELPNSFPSL